MRALSYTISPEIARSIALERLRIAAADGVGDPEASHSVADAALCDLLVSLGYQDVVDAWEKVEKWYA